ncbi:MAG: FKBP-type peptidyl-prolyl cis-trans isomerase [Patescibacteria group bacterium]|nr:FKBP-type peptidyl-prolyl cis-trans isomerase [Patescibacteria group bacterium]MCL5261790.1 FKBP-type peptidyl-prolyl cis-trans isomerase [Patescibacteria group bacterium]
MKPYIIFAVIGLIVVVLAWRGESLILSKFNPGSAPAEEGESLTGTAGQTGSQANVPTSSPEDQLKFDIIKNGDGPAIQNGDLATVNYIGRLKDGTVFDSSYDRGVPFQFKLGAGQVIKGWDMGVLGMKAGEKRQLVIPARFGYGSAGMGSIPGGATLVFEVELMKIN